MGATVSARGTKPKGEREVERDRMREGSVDDAHTKLDPISSPISLFRTTCEIINCWSVNIGCLSRYNERKIKKRNKRETVPKNRTEKEKRSLKRKKRIFSKIKPLFLSHEYVK